MKEYIMHKWNDLELFLSRKFHLYKTNFHKLDQYMHNKFESIDQSIDIFDQKIQVLDHKFAIPLQILEDKLTLNVKSQDK